MVPAAVRVTLPALGFGTAYAAALLVGRATRVEGTEISLIWPAAAVAVLWGAYAHDLPAGRAIGHWSVLGALTFVVALATGGPLELAVWSVGVHLALAAVPAAVLGHGGRGLVLREPRDLGRLAVAVTAGTLLAAVLAIAYFAQAGQDDLTGTFALFFVRNAVTALAGVAVVLRLRDARWRLARPSGPRAAETLICIVVVTAVFGRIFWFDPNLPVGFSIMLPALWVSLRFSTTTSTVFVSIAGVTIVWATLLDRGVLHGIAPKEQSALAQGMVGCLVVVVLSLALFRDSRDELIGQLRRLALHDPLTGVANRALLTERLEEALERGARGTVGVIMLDLDGFKLVNDAWGHAEGDLLLVEIARRLEEVVPPGDTVARLGGDEFVVVSTELRDLVDLHARAERIRQRVADPYGLVSDAPYDRITASVGCAWTRPGDTARTLLLRADQAMYDAKRSGGGLSSRLTGPAGPSGRSPAGPRAAAGVPAPG